jgi:imidazole glycerol-phosphate synthase subunit HisF
VLTRRVIPCLDVRDGRVVKGVQFSSLRDAGDPVACAAEYERQGADELVVLDVSATPEGRGANLGTIRSIRASLGIPLTLGGGLRTVADGASLLETGADKVAINTAAVDQPSLISTLAERFGSQCVVVALDAARSDDSWIVVTRSGRTRTSIDAVRWAATAASLGAGEILLTSWDRDGTGAGYDLELLAAIRGAVNIPIIASGGAAGPSHMADALEAGADAVLAASIFHDSKFTVADVKQALARRGMEIRP